MRRAAELISETGRAGEAITWLRTRRRAGDTAALDSAAQLMTQTGRAGEAITWLRTRARPATPPPWIQQPS